MASVKSALVLVALLALGEGLNTVAINGCSLILDSCYRTYTGAQSLGTPKCAAYRAMKACVSSNTSPDVCSEADVSAHSDIQAAYSDNTTCGGSLPKASLIGIVLAVVVGLLFRA